MASRNSLGLHLGQGNLAATRMSKPPSRVATRAREWCPGQDSNLRPSAPESHSPPLTKIRVR